MKPRTELFETFAIQGITLRDHFAGQAMEALVTGKDDYCERRVAQLAFELADEMMKARGVK